jgi:transcriptional regulator GlxA family with amidase domain
MLISCVLYPGFTALDIVGPFNVLADVPGHDVRFVAASTGPVLDHTGRAAIVATDRLEDVTSPDIVVVPGGTTYDLEGPVVQWLRQVRPTWTTSVCTGSIYLAAAGLLEGIDATTHWAATALLERYGARYVSERVVERGQVITAAGVSSGIDMALTLVGRLHGDLVAQAVQLAIEYDPQPPYDSGSVAKAPAEVVDLVRNLRSLRPNQR